MLIRAPILLCLLLACAGPRPSGMRVLAWEPRADVEPAPLAGARVLIRCPAVGESEWQTGVDGRTELPTFLDGECALQISKDGYRTKSFQVGERCPSGQACDGVRVVVELTRIALADAAAAVIALENYEENQTRPIIERGPPARSDLSRATLEFDCDKPPCDFRCGVTTGPSPKKLESCTSPWTSRRLTDGDHTFWLESSKNTIPGAATEHRWSTNTSTWTSVETGLHHGCAIDEQSHLWCWGREAGPALGRGRGDTSDPTVPARVGEAPYQYIAVGAFFSCGVRSDGTMWCWGDSVSAIGRATDEDAYEPRQVGGANNWGTVYAGSWHACGLKHDGTLWCWGNNAWGAVGDGTGAPGTDRQRQEPAPVMPTARWRDIALGDEHSCGIQRDGTLWCWGRASGGVLGVRKGHPDTQQKAAYPYAPWPIKVGEAFWTDVAAGDGHTCGVQEAGSMWCWGEGDYGQLGLAELDPREPQLWWPERVGADTDWTRVEAGQSHTCGERKEGSVWCWGGHALGGEAGVFGADPTPSRVHAGGKGWRFFAGEGETCMLTPVGGLRCHRVGAPRPNGWD